MYFSKIILSALPLVASVSACCSSGCYCVKVEPRFDGQCQNVDVNGKASIANYAAAGNCLDLANYYYLAPFNDGCESSKVAVSYYYSMSDCLAHPDGEGQFSYTSGHTSGECLTKPSGAMAARAVCGS